MKKRREHFPVGGTSVRHFQRERGTDDGWEKGVSSILTSRPPIKNSRPTPRLRHGKLP